jgi:hypothetical protein
MKIVLRGARAWLSDDPLKASIARLIFGGTNRLYPVDEEAKPLCRIVNFSDSRPPSPSLRLSQ